MSKSRRQWSGGKGDDSRVSDYKGYRNNFDNIDFSKRRENKKSLFLDDEIPSSELNNSDEENNEDEL